MRFKLAVAVQNFHFIDLKSDTNKLAKRMMKTSFQQCIKETPNSSTLT